MVRTNKKSNGTSLPTASDEVYNLEVLVEKREDGKHVARAANLKLEKIESATVRGALGKLVESAKSLIREKRKDGSDIPWLVPASEPVANETRFLVPLHL